MNIFTSRKFYALLIGLIMMVVLALFPGFPDIQEHVVEVAVLIGAYIVGTALDPRETWQNKLLGLLYSSKFWVTTAGLVFLVLKTYIPTLPFSEEQIIGFVGTLATFIIGKGLSDQLKE